MEINKIQEAAKVFAEAIAQDMGTKEVMVCWCVGSGEELASGIHLGEGVDSGGLQSMMFRLNGRAYLILNS